MDNTQNNQPIQPQDALIQNNLQNQQQAPISVPVGGAEGAPARVESAPIIENHDVKLSDVEPNIPPEVEDYVQPSPQPKIHSDAVAAGVKKSIPDSPYGNLPIDEIQIKQDLEAPLNRATPWRALLSKFQIAKAQFRAMLSQQPQEVN